MNKPSERLFKFPIKLYHSFYLRKAEQQEIDTNAEDPIEVNWVQGWARVPIYEVLGWHQSFSRGLRQEDFRKDGCDIVIVQTEHQGDFMCLWDMNKFEEKYNTHYEKYEEWIEDVYVEGVLDKAIKEPGK